MVWLLAGQKYLITCRQLEGELWALSQFPLFRVATEG